jgi:septin family protein
MPSPNHNSNAEPDSTVSTQKSTFSSHYLETEMDGERVGLTLWDSAGLEKNLVDLQMREMVAFVESKFEETFVEEQKVMRSPGAKDTHIHCVFLVLDPIRLDATVAASSATQKGTINLANVSGLDDDLDLQVIRALWGKTTVIPVISKADTLTVGHMAFLKRAVWQSIKGAKMDPLEALELEDDIEEEDEDEEEEDSQDDSSDVIDSYNDSSAKAKKSHKRQSSLSVRSNSVGGDEDTPYIPMAILSPDPYDLPPYVPKAKAGKVGRRFPWGLADPYNPDHCDFTRLRDSIFSEWKGELRDLSRSKWYENWRTSRLKNLPGSKQRLKGGVTPVSSVPGGGRGASAGYSGAGAVPRSVSGNQSTAGANSMDGKPSKAERIMGVPAGGANGAHY